MFNADILADGVRGVPPFWFNTVIILVHVSKFVKLVEMSNTFKKTTYFTI